MFAPRRLCVYPPSLLASVSPLANSFVSPTYANSGGWGAEGSKHRATTSSITFNIAAPRPIRKTPNHYRVSHLSNKCRRADIPVSGITHFPSSTFRFPYAHRLPASLRTDNCELTRKCRRADIFNCSPNGACSEQEFQGTGRWSLATRSSRVTGHEPRTTFIVGAPTFRHRESPSSIFYFPISFVALLKTDNCKLTTMWPCGIIGPSSERRPPTPT